MILYDSTLITPTTGLMIWTLVTFVIVLIVLRKFAFGPIQQLIDTRRQAIVADLDAAQAAREEAQARWPSTASSWPRRARRPTRSSRTPVASATSAGRRRSPSSRPRRRGSCSRPRRRSSPRRAGR